MITARATATLAVVMLLGAGCAKVGAGPQADTKAIEAQAHGDYLAAINNNNLETLMADLTDDVVYQSPNEPELVGKAAVGKWAADYIGAYAFKWEKTSIGFTVAGDWAFERYAYKVANTDRKTGAVSTDQGKGVNVFHHDADGKWRVAIDGWSSSLPAPK
jgi:ketosteroid isomerase-like protein